MQRPILCALVFLISLMPLMAVAEEAVDVMTLTLPEGDPEAGRAAFLALSCTSCHRVTGESEFPAPVSANPGPEIGRYQGQQSPSRLASSIFAPSHEVSWEQGKSREDDLSPMGDFSEAMTVRQFLDLIAYIRSFAVPGAKT